MKHLRTSITFLLYILVIPLWGQSLSLVTWNIQTLGRSKSDAEIAAMARILKDVDIVAVQEVVGKDPAGAQAVARLADALDRTGADWDYNVSDPTTGTSHESERYAYLWKTSRANLVGRPGLAGTLADLVVREPYVAHFRTRAGDLVLVNFHAVPHDKQPEREIKVIRSLTSAFGDLPVVFMADWNVVDHHTVFNPLKREGYRFAVEGQLTTLKKSCVGGQYTNHGIDNILFPSSLEAIRSGVLDFVGDCHRLETARMISDHLPVWVELRTILKP